MSYGLEMCSRFAAGTEVGWLEELSVSSALAVLTSSVEFCFNNIGLFLIRALAFVHRRARVLPNNL
jgi:hypothetical protein